MDRTNCQLIAFDLDGTLLDDRKRIPPENLSALEEAAARGIELVPATGRIFRGLPEEIKSLPFLRYYILSNGASVYDRREDRILYRGEIPVEEALACYRYLDTLPVIYDCYQGEQGWMTRTMLEAAEPYFVTEPEVLKMLYALRRPVDDLKEFLRGRGLALQKLQMFFRPEDEALRRETIREIAVRFPRLKPTSSVSNNIEVNSVDAGKGKALLGLCEALGIPRSGCVAFGDGSNDIEMLEAAGLGIAMQNAAPEVKAAAGRIAGDNNEGGVGRMIRLLLAEDDARRQALRLP